MTVWIFLIVLLTQDGLLVSTSDAFVSLPLCEGTRATYRLEVERVHGVRGQTYPCQLVRVAGRP